MSFTDFQNKLHNNANTQEQVMSNEELKTTISKSNSILSGFEPQ